MTEEQKEAYGKFARLAKNKNVHFCIALVVASVMLNSEDWRATLNDITCLLEECKDGDDFATRLIRLYPGQDVAQEPIDD